MFGREGPRCHRRSRLRRGQYICRTLHASVSAWWAAARVPSSAPCTAWPRASTITMCSSAGALSASPEKARNAQGIALGLEAARSYGSYAEMFAAETPARGRHRGRVDRYAEQPRTRISPLPLSQAGVHVICDKPMCTTPDAGAQRIAARGRPPAAASFAVTYNYTGYPMVREARALVRDGAIGRGAHGAGGVCAGLAERSRWR